MIIKTQVVFTDEHQSDVLGKDVSLEEDFEFNLDDVSGLMPGNASRSQTIIFLTGNSLTIKKPFEELRDLWRAIKKSKDERLN